MTELDSIIHQPVCLKVMAALTALRAGDQLEFVTLREMLDLTDGNLSVHLRKLEDEGYVDIEKVFVGRKLLTFIRVTPKGRSAFEAHTQALREIIGA